MVFWREGSSIKDIFILQNPLLRRVRGVSIVNRCISARWSVRAGAKVSATCFLLRRLSVIYILSNRETQAVV